jgi:hypothetical protein
MEQKIFWSEQGLFLKNMEFLWEFDLGPIFFDVSLNRWQDQRTEVFSAMIGQAYKAVRERSVEEEGAPERPKPLARSS